MLLFPDFSMRYRKNVCSAMKQKLPSQGIQYDSAFYGLGQEESNANGFGQRTFFLCFSRHVICKIQLDGTLVKGECFFAHRKTIHDEWDIGHRLTLPPIKYTWELFCVFQYLKKRRISYLFTVLRRILLLASFISTLTYTHTVIYTVIFFLKLVFLY